MKTLPRDGRDSNQDRRWRPELAFAAGCWGHGQMRKIDCNPFSVTIIFWGVAVDLNTVTVLSSALAAIAALVVASITLSQLRHSRFALGVDLLLRLEAQFDASEMKTLRSQAESACRTFAAVTSLAASSSVMLRLSPSAIRPSRKAAAGCCRGGSTIV